MSVKTDYSNMNDGNRKFTCSEGWSLRDDEDGGDDDDARIHNGKLLPLLGFGGLSPSSSESLSTMGGIRIRTCRRSLCTTSCSRPRDFSISFPASLRDRFSVTVPLI